MDNPAYQCNFSASWKPSYSRFLAGLSGCHSIPLLVQPPPLQTFCSCKEKCFSNILGDEKKCKEKCIKEPLNLNKRMNLHIHIAGFLKTQPTAFITT